MRLRTTKFLTGALMGIILSGGLGVHSALAFKINETRYFFVEPAYDYSGRSQLSATLQQVGDNILIYTADDWWASLNAVDLAEAKDNITALAVEFDKTIYPRLTQVYGSEWSPGIDNEARLTVLVARLKKNSGGYFNTADEYPRAQLASSNEREMIYLNADYLGLASDKVFLAHEFQHLISFYQKEKLRNSVEEVWLNEARSEYTAALCGYNSPFSGSSLESRLKEFLRSPSDSLTEWQNEPADYGVVNIFMQYLVSRYGEQILTRMMKTEAVGIASIDQALAGAGLSERFPDVFTNWVVASYINDCQLGTGQKYCYLNSVLNYDRLNVAPRTINVLKIEDGTAFSFADSVKDWAGQWYEVWPLGSGLNLMISFKGSNSSNFQVPILITNSDGTKNLRFLKLDSAQIGSTVVLDFGRQVAKVAILLSNQTKMSGFSTNETVYPFSYIAKITSATSAPETSLPASSPAVSPAPKPANPSQTTNPNLPDGTLIRAQGDTKVYIIKGNYRRWLQTPAILLSYPHLGWQSVMEVMPEQLNFYQEAWLVRADGDTRVYEINGDGTKHWLNMTAEQFSVSGRQWAMVYLINRAERDLYRTGVDVLK